MVTRPFFPIALSTLLVTCASFGEVARANEPAVSTTHAEVHHAPPATATAHAPLEIGAQIDHIDRAKRVLLIYRSARGMLEVPFERSAKSDAPYIAVIPEADVTPPQLAYTIECENLDGSRARVFASRTEMHAVEVQGDLTDDRETLLLARLDGRRSVMTASGDYVDFGRSSAVVHGSSQSFHDGYYQVEAEYTYRALRTVAEFGIRAGVMRGQSVVPGEQDPSKFDVGLNYGAPRLRLRASDGFHIEGEFLTSVTEVGFAVGGGGALILGDPYATRMTLGFETIDQFGTRAYSRFDIQSSKRLVLSPVIEVTSMPHADNAGVRLLGAAAIDLGAGFTVALRGGYQARSFSSGGASAGTSLSYAF